MPDLQDSKYLALEQYKDSSNLDARIQLHQRFSTNPYGWFKRGFNQFSLLPGAHILEIGCGSGTLWVENRSRIPSGWRVILSDFSPGMVNNAQRNIGPDQSSFGFDVSDGMTIPFPIETFDGIIANHVIYRLPDCKKFLVEVNRVLKPGGMFFASTIGKNHFIELSQILDGFTPTRSKDYSPMLTPEGFTLENGTEQLAPWFARIEVRQYPDALVTTEAQPLIEYILSMINSAEIFIHDEAISALTSQINHLISHRGSIYIQKCSGIFICNKSGKGK